MTRAIQRKRFACTAATLAASIIAVALASPVLAGSGDRWRHDDRGRGARDHGVPKDCTRYNGRWGYYGNPWCTPAEQRAFDIWDARRVERLRRGR